MSSTSPKRPLHKGARRCKPDSAELQAPLVLERFLPYRLAVLAHHVSRAIARRYEVEFDLTIPEWRVLALLAIQPGLTAREVAAKTPMDKVAVSRAVRRLTDNGRLTAVVDRGDGRRLRLRLTTRGLGVYSKIAPLARELEAQLLASLTPEEHSALNTVIGKLEMSARTLEGEHGTEPPSPTGH